MLIVLIIYYLFLYYNVGIEEKNEKDINGIRTRVPLIKKLDLYSLRHGIFLVLFCYITYLYNPILILYDKIILILFISKRKVLLF